MYPNVFTYPIDISGFKELSGVIDAVYNPINSTLVQSARERGISAEGGLYMLVAQAIKASELFTDTKCPSYMIDVIYEGIKAEKENVVLIGMPASGKSTVGKMLAERLTCDFVDTDELIIEKIKMPIKDYFEKYGDEKFRDVECEVVKSLVDRGGIVIATGGGAILRKENLEALRYNGKLYFIDRPLDMLIPTESRPLSSDRMSIEKLYNERYSTYCNCCDLRIDADADAESVVDKILETF